MTWPSTLANRVSSRPLRLDEAPFLWAISALLVLLRARPAAAGGRLGLAVLRPARLGLGVRGLGLGAGLGSGAAGGLRLGAALLGLGGLRLATSVRGLGLRGLGLRGLRLGGLGGRRLGLGLAGLGGGAGGLRLRVGVLVLGGAGGRLRLGGGLGPAWRVDDVHPDPGQRLAVALVAALAGLVLVGDHEQRDELDAVAVATDPLHVDDVTDLDLVLLSAGADDGVHVSTVLPVRQRETAASRNRRA